MQMQRQKIAACHCPAALKRELGHLAVAELIPQFIETAQTLDIGYRFDVEGKQWSHQ
jgi:hypothetical protein